MKTCYSCFAKFLITSLILENSVLLTYVIGDGLIQILSVFSKDRTRSFNKLFVYV